MEIDVYNFFHALWQVVIVTNGSSCVATEQMMVHGKVQSGHIRVSSLGNRVPMSILPSLGVIRATLFLIFGVRWVVRNLEFYLEKLSAKANGSRSGESSATDIPPKVACARAQCMWTKQTTKHAENGMFDLFQVEQH